MKIRSVIAALAVALMCGCVSGSPQVSLEFPILSWGGIPANKADSLFALAKECGFTHHLGLYRAPESLIAALDAAQRAGISMIAGHPYIKDSTEQAVAAIKDHPALAAYHLKDEPELSDFEWLKSVYDRVRELDPVHACYINLYPNWAWGEQQYAQNIEAFASLFDLSFYSFDNYPIIELEGQTVVRPEWYRNLEEFSEMARMHKSPFWGFALATSHYLDDPSYPVFYPLPTLGQLRLQVFSNLLYGAQGIQYFTYAGLVDAETCSKKTEYEYARQVNGAVKAYSCVFSGCEISGVWHIGDSIPSHTKRLSSMPHAKLKSLSVDGKGAVVSLIKNGKNTYLAVQNRDFENAAILDVSFRGKVIRITEYAEFIYDGNPVNLEPGNVAIFRLK